MLPKWHILFGGIFALSLYLLGLDSSSSVIIFFSSFLIDADHYLYRIFKTRSLNLIKIYNICKNHREKWIKLSPETRRNYKRPIHYFHGIEFFIPILTLSFFSPFFFFILAGILSHFFIDYAELYFYEEPFYSKASQIYVYITNKNKKELILKPQKSKISDGSQKTGVF